MPFIVRDLLYLDFEKAASIWSQLEGGLRERISITEDEGGGRKAGVRFGIPKIAEAELGVDYADKRSTLESKILHHDVLNRVESQLNEAGLVADLSEHPKTESSAESIRIAIGSRPYLKALGWGVIEDYQRILTIAERFNDVVDFIGKCAFQSIKKSPDYLVLCEQIETLRSETNKLIDRNQKAVAKARVKELESALGGLTKAQLSRIDDWLIEGIKLWINTFMPNRINFRIYPFEQCPSFQVICNLKRGCFVDQDLEHLLYGYGNRPNVPLMVFGLITSIPGPAEDMFDPMKEFEAGGDLADRIAFEKAFRAIFAGMEGIEALVRYSRYPNVTVHPIAVFREF
jgi:hypothetical protein